MTNGGIHRRVKRRIEKVLVDERPTSRIANTPLLNDSVGRNPNKSVPAVSGYVSREDEWTIDGVSVETGPLLKH